MKTADLILCADLHLRADTPVCRTDDYFGAQQRKVRWLADLQRRHGCPVVVAGDVFDVYRPGEFLLQWAIKELPAELIAVPGQHDMPQHSMRLYEKSGLAVLEAAGRAKVLKEPSLYAKNKIGIVGFPYGETFSELSPLLDQNIAVIHAYVAEQVPAFIEGWTPAQLLAALPGYDLIVAGDNHVPTVYEHRGRLVVNCGAMMRMSADEGDARPRVYLWWADANKVEPLYFPIEAGVVSREHLDGRQERDARLSAFVERLDEGGVGGLSFEANLENYLRKNKVEERVYNIVWEAVSDK